MLRALYPFKKTHPTSLGFGQGDVFVELSGASNDKNWHYAMANNGESGYIPKSYVMQEKVSPEALSKHVDALQERVRLRGLPNKEKAELLANLQGVKKRYADGLISPRSSSASSGARSISPSAKSSSSSKKRAAPPPPATSSSNGPNPSTKSGPHQQQQHHHHHHPNLQPQVVVVNNSPKSTPAASDQRRPSLADPTSDQLKAHAKDLVQLVHMETGLSQDNAQSAVHSVLQYICTNLHRLDRNVPGLLSELEFPLLGSSSAASSQAIALDDNADAKAMQSLLERLTQCKEDDQQRNWMLYEDEAAIGDLLRSLSDALRNCDRAISVHVMSKFKYFYIHNLVEYFQMETRWSLRRLLIENFMLMCSVDPLIISLLLNSVLPLELAQDLYENTTSVNRLRHCALLLTVVFSTGEPMPVHYFNQLGANFINFLLDYIEAPPTQDSGHEIPDVFAGLALSYNLQFPDVSTNVLVSCLSGRAGAKTYTEKVLLLLNREEDPTALVVRKNQSSAINQPHAVHKVVLDMFLHDTCHQLFYTNDIYVLIDIIVRQLADLGPEPESNRGVYVRMCRLVLRHTDYSEHLHRFKDLERCFMSILEEEEESSAQDRVEVEAICREVEAFNSLLG